MGCWGWACSTRRGLYETSWTVRFELAAEALPYLGSTVYGRETGVVRHASFIRLPAHWRSSGLAEEQATQLRSARAGASTHVHCPCLAANQARQDAATPVARRRRATTTRHIAHRRLKVPGHQETLRAQVAQTLHPGAHVCPRPLAFGKSHEQASSGRVGEWASVAQGDSAEW